MRLLLFVLGFVVSVAPAEEDLLPQRLATGFRFTEGPAAGPDGSVYFSDIPNERIHRVDAKGQVSLFCENSGRANGLMWNAKGELVACEGGTGRVVAWSAAGKRLRVLAERFGGKRFNAPNDLVIDRAGGVYFTDPEFGRAVKKPQGTFAVYYIAAKGSVTRVIESLPKPNGIILSPDEKTLYVVSSGSATVTAYPVQGVGQLGKERAFFQLRQPEGMQNTGGDGLTVDTNGRLYITSRLGIQVVSATGKFVRLFEFPEKPANVTFGGPKRQTLYVTARTSVYTLPVAATGHRFALAQPVKPKPAEAPAKK